MGGPGGDEYFDCRGEESEGREKAEEGVWSGSGRVSLVTRMSDQKIILKIKSTAKMSKEGVRRKLERLRAVKRLKLNAVLNLDLPYL